MPAARISPAAPLRRLAAGSLVAALCLVLAAPASADRVRVYKKSDGSLLFTNRPERVVREPGMSLLEERVYGNDHYVHAPARLTAARRDAYDDIINTAAERWSVDFALVKAVIHAESAFDPDAVSRVGARGLMQLMPATAAMLQVRDIHDPYQNINAGARYLRLMLDHFNGNIAYALAAYNAGEANVRKYNGIPPFRETQYYVSKVKELQAQYRELSVAQR